jgi:tyrosine decarboxylase/aspartate 1-decarboxylase
MWDRGAPDEQVMAELQAALARDHSFAGGHVISSMCTKPLDIAARAHAMFIESNLGNAGLYPGTLELEKAAVGAIGSLLNGHGAAGGIVSGGTEANITALWMARNVTGRRKVVFPRSAHFSLHKACDILGMVPVMVGLTDRFTIDIEEAADRCGPDVAAVVGIAGTTELGAVDDISGLAAILPDGAFLHVDAAFGGFVLPFLKELGSELPDFDFSVPEVASMAADPHKMGLSTVPSGALMVRDREWIKTIHKEAPYLDMLGQLSALSGTRCSAAAAATYAAMRSLGREGYLAVVERCMAVTAHAESRARKVGIEPVMRPVMNILCLRVPEPKEVQRELDRRGWKVSVSQNPPALRLVMMPHVTIESVDGLFDEMAGVLGA